MPNYWILAVSEENWYVIKSAGVYGAPEPQRGRPIYELVRPGDVVIFYVRKKGSTSFGGKFAGAFRVVSSWFREDSPLWPDEAREGRVKYSWRVRLEPIRLGAVGFEELAPKLKFVGNKSRAHAYLVGTPANLKRPIPEEDAKLIIESLK